MTLGWWYGYGNDLSGLLIRMSGGVRPSAGDRQGINLSGLLVLTSDEAHINCVRAVTCTLSNLRVASKYNLVAHSHLGTKMLPTNKKISCKLRRANERILFSMVDINNSAS